ncbi:MAG: hypothetical protein HFE45_06585 [Oscillospiraceae bacterium]|nr:hypothetical protein [Oscillospiraceae bacterium]
MNGVFNQNGHISDQGLWLLTAGDPDALCCYELSEHLDYCDQCVDRYSVLLTENMLMAPPSGLAKPVMAKVRRGNILFLTKRAIKVCTAASLTVVIWYSGLFGDSLAVRNEKIPDQARRGNSFSQMVSGVSDSIGNWIRGFGIYSRGE